MAADVGSMFQYWKKFDLRRLQVSAILTFLCLFFRRYALSRCLGVCYLVFRLNARLKSALFALIVIRNWSPLCLCSVQSLIRGGGAAEQAVCSAHRWGISTADSTAASPLRLLLLSALLTPARTSSPPASPLSQPRKLLMRLRISVPGRRAATFPPAQCFLRLVWMSAASAAPQRSLTVVHTDLSALIPAVWGISQPGSLLWCS